MERDSKKRIAVVLITVAFMLMLLSLPLLYLKAGVPLLPLAGLAAFYIALAAGMAYVAHERLKEIDEGLDDAVDDY